jgi:hypothetical protein
MNMIHITGSKAIEIAQQHAPEGQRLKLLDIVLADRVQDAQRARQHRAKFLRDVRELAERGKLAIVSGGRDCDCAEWRDAVSIVPATVAAVDAWVESFYSNAEGPQWHYIARPSVARKLKRSSRDLALEAFENGHPHYITTASV